MKNEPKYHLLKRHIGKKTVYHAGFLADTLNENGKLHYTLTKSTGQTSKVASIATVKKWLEDGRIFASKDDVATYFTEFWNLEKSEYLRSQQIETGRSYSVTYVEGNCRRLENYFLPWLKAHGVTQLNQITRQVLTLWRNDLADGKIVPERKDHKKAKALSPVTMNRIRAAAWVAIEYAVDQGLLPDHPGLRVKRISERGAAVAREHFERDELTAIFCAPWNDQRAKVACLLAAVTGARQGEVRGLLMRNYHPDSASVDIVTSWQDNQKLKPPKWDSTRFDVPLPDSVCKELDTLIEHNPYGKNPDSFVFYGLKKDVPIQYETINKGLKDAIKMAKVRGGRTFHSFRHTWVTHSRGLVRDSAVMAIVGHTQTTTTDGYTGVSSEDRKALADYSESLVKDSNRQLLQDTSE